MARPARQKRAKTRFERRMGATPHPEERRPRAALYLRVSKGEQTPESQRADVQRVARARGFEVVAEYVETASAVRMRPAFKQMLAAALAGQLDAIVVWAIDRFGRSMYKNILDVLELDRWGVQLVSVREPWLDNEGPVRDLLVAIFSWVAEQERRRIIERTNAGLERARAKGVRLGRPPRTFTATERARVHVLKAQGSSTRAIAKELGAPETVLRRFLAGGLSAQTAVDELTRFVHAPKTVTLPEGGKPLGSARPKRPRRNRPV